MIATARSLEKIQDFPKTDKIRLMQLDVTEGFQTIREKFDRAAKFFGRVDVLVNNVGRSTRGRILDVTVEELQSLLELNFLTAVRTTRDAL